MNARIVAHDAGVRFCLDRQRRLTTPTLAGLRRGGSETWGLRGISLTIGAGEGVALLGLSGSGKTSLLRTLAGVYEPDAGWVRVEGRVASLLSVEAGLMGRLTGRENSRLLGVLAGESRAASRAAAPEVQRRSGLGDGFDRPVASFSQGMSARLGFAAADRGDAAILLLDEVHEAFDHEFRAVIERRADELKAAGGIIVAAGHDHAILERMCTRAIWLRDGAVAEDGPFEAVRAAYLSTV